MINSKTEMQKKVKIVSTPSLTSHSTHNKSFRETTLCRQSTALVVNTKLLTTKRKYTKKQKCTQLWSS